MKTFLHLMTKTRFLYLFHEMEKCFHNSSLTSILRVKYEEEEKRGFPGGKPRLPPRVIKELKHAV